MKSNLLLAGLALILLCCASCVQHGQLINFRKSDDTSIDGYRAAIALPSLEVQSDDILYITVNSLDDRASAPYNLVSQQSGGGGGGGGNNQNQLLLQGYTVDSTGYIDFPNIGRIKVGGLSLEGVRNEVARSLEPYLPGAGINVKFLNFRYTIIGDVANPGTYTTINERVSLLEAIGTAGDLTPYAARQEIYVIREKNGERTAHRLDLQSPEFLSSPYYYLRQNDVIYIEPTESKIAIVADPVNRLISYGSAFLSLVTLGLAVFLK